MYKFIYPTVLIGLIICASASKACAASNAKSSKNYTAGNNTPSISQIKVIPDSKYNFSPGETVDVIVIETVLEEAFTTKVNFYKGQLKLSTNTPRAPPF